MCVQRIKDSSRGAGRQMCSRPCQFSEAVDAEDGVCSGEDAHELVHVPSLPISQGKGHTITVMLSTT